MDQKDLFEQCLLDSIDTCPILLIDNSQSTTNTFSPTANVFDYMGQKLHSLLEEKKIKESYALAWSSEASTKVLGHVSTPDLLSLLKKISLEGEHTDLSTAFHSLPSGWLEKQHIDIYIVTDGEINKDVHHFGQQIKDLIHHNVEKKIQFYILTVEANDTDYSLHEANAGNKLFQIIQDNNLTHYVQTFVSFNHRFSDQPFYHLCKPNLQRGYIPFKNKSFSVLRLHLFLQYVSTLIKKLSEEEVFSLLHDLFPTIDTILKHQAPLLHEGIVDMFCQLFRECKNYSEICISLRTGLEKFRKGAAITYHQYKNERKSIFENAQKLLYENVSRNICQLHHEHEFQSFPISLQNNKHTKYLYRVHSSQVQAPLRIGIQKYPQACFSFDKYNLPILPMSMDNTTPIQNQCLRQWIRTVYSLLYHLSSSDDMILYLYLSNMLSVCLSDGVSKKTKKNIIKMGEIMLEKGRFQSTEREIDSLLDGNPPLPSVESSSYMTSILNQCACLSGFQNIHAYTLWYGIIMLLGNKQLIKNQYTHCKDDLKKDLPRHIQTKDLLSFLKTKSSFTYQEKDFFYPMEELEYFCYLTLEDTSSTGGYKLPPHPFAPSNTCSPRYVISKEGWNALKEKNSSYLTCPLCYTPLQFNTLIKVPGLEDKESENNRKRKRSQEEKNLLLPSVFRLQDKYKKVEEFQDKKEISALYPMTQCCFDPVPCMMEDATILTPVLSNNTFVKVTTQQMFHEKVKEKYPFLFDLDLSNMCIMGGFCRSILLDQEVNDIDLYFIGIPHSKIQLRVEKFINNLTQVLPKLKFLCLFKEKNNVYEVLAFDEEDEEILYKFQLFLCSFATLKELVNESDLYPASVIWDQKKVYFTNGSHYAYRCMINVMDGNRYTQDSFRLKKYFDHGFAIVLPKFDLAKFKNQHGSEFTLGSSRFTVQHIKENVVFIDSLRIVSAQSAQGTENPEQEPPKQGYKGIIQRKRKDFQT